jgi:hypothetical protein
MSLSVANYDWIRGKSSGILGQFASTLGYTELISAARAREYPALAAFFGSGVSDDVTAIRSELAALAAATRDPNVRGCAIALRRLTAGQTKVPLVITNGAS